MLVHIKHILGESELQTIQELLKNADFRDGHLSAGMVAQQVKNNQEVSNENISNKLNNLMILLWELVKIVIALTLP